MCFRAILYAVFHSIRIGFVGSKLKIVDQKASDGRVSHSGFQFLHWLQVHAGLPMPHTIVARGKASVQRISARKLIQVRTGAGAFLVSLMVSVAK